MAEFKSYAEYDADADALYVHLVDLPVKRSNPVDDSRVIDLAEDSTVVGAEFIGVGAGIGLSDLPHARKLEKLIGDLGLGIKLFA